LKIPEQTIARASFLTSAVKPEQFPPPELPEIAFAGRSNVGKSTMINKLVGRKKFARISRTPGRTQTINFYEINGEFYLVDLPGYGFARVPASIRAGWRPMVESYLSAERRLCAVVLILDLRRDPQAEERNLLDWLDDRAILPIITATKADKLKRGRRIERAESIRRDLGLPEPPLIFSGLTGEGKAEIWERLIAAMALNDKSPQDAA